MSRPSHRLARSTPIAFAFAAGIAMISYFSVGREFAVIVFGGLILISVLASGLIRRYPERVVLIAGVIILGAGLIGTSEKVVRAAGDHRVETRGRLDVSQIRAQARPGERTSTADLERRGLGYLTAAEGTTRSYRTTDGTIVGWAVGEYAPWALAILTFALAVPLLRAAERGDPFLPGAADRLGLIGTLLLFGIPFVRVVQWFAAELAPFGTPSIVGPLADPRLSIAATDLLPGVVVIVLAGIFRRGFELRDLEQHTV